jgi:hypothetical protein
MKTIVTVEPRRRYMLRYIVHCTSCEDEFIGEYRTQREAQQWAEHHRHWVHADEYPTKPHHKARPHFTIQ